MTATVTHLPVPQASDTPLWLRSAALYFRSRRMPPSYARAHGFPELAEAMEALCLT